MRSFVLLLLVCAAVGLLASLANAQTSSTTCPGPEESGPPASSSFCRAGKFCCSNRDFNPNSVPPSASADPFRCYNLQTSDDHCGQCSIRCSKTAFRRCIDGVCSQQLGTVDLTRQNRDCAGLPTATALSPNGFVVFSLSNTGVIRAQIVLNSGSGASAGVYNVRLIQVGQAADDCTAPAQNDGTITVLPDGSGQAIVTDVRLVGATQVFAALNFASNPNDFFTTPTVTLP